MRHIIRRTAGLFAGCLLFLSAEATAAEPVPARADGAPRQNAPAHRDAASAGDVGNAERAKRTKDAASAGDGTSRSAAPDTTGMARRAAADTVSRGAARRRASAYRTGYDTGYRNGYAARIPGRPGSDEETSLSHYPAIVLLLRGHDRPQAEARPQHRRGIPPGVHSPDEHLSGRGQHGGRTDPALAGPPTCVIRSVSAPGRAPTVSTAAYTRGSGSPITASATAGSWATRLPSTSSRARASHASARWYRSTTSGISACRSDGNPTTRTTTAPTS